MMRSMFSGVSGLRVHQTKMDVIANNIANVNTVGFKASRVTFRDAFYQRLQGAAGPNAETGRTGTNPMQIGLGAMLGSIDTLMSQGLSQRTDNAYDIMVQGNGFFVVGDGSGTYFTRAGNITRDPEWNLSINGMALMGWDAVKGTDGVVRVVSGPVAPISLGGEKQKVPAEPTTNIGIEGNLNITQLDENNQIERNMTMHDTVGNRYSVDVIFTYHPQPDSNHGFSFWTFEFKQGTKMVDPNNPSSALVGPGVIAYPVGQPRNENTKQILGMHVFDPGAAAPNPPAGGLLDAATFLKPQGTLVFNTRGELVGYGSAVAPAGTPPRATPNLLFDSLLPNAPAPTAGQLIPGKNITLLLAPATVLDPTATFGKNSGSTVSYAPAGGGTLPGAPAAGTITNPIGEINLNFANLFQREGESTNAKFLMVDGNAPGTLEDISVGPDGKITGRYSNGRTRVLGQIPVAKFQNPPGLEKVGNNLFVVTSNSGQFDGTGETGDIIGGALEMSNVDLSQEFTEMITTQRGFQANSRIITVSDDMLQELVNLKR